MGSFDGELYLRLRGEELLLGPRSNQPRDSPLEEAASALVAVGVLEGEIARSVIDEYDAALELRGDQHAWMARLHSLEAQRQPVEDDSSPRLVRLHLRRRAPHRDA